MIINKMEENVCAINKASPDLIASLNESAISCKILEESVDRAFTFRCNNLSEIHPNPEVGIMGQCEQSGMADLISAIAQPEFDF